MCLLGKNSKFCKIVISLNMWFRRRDIKAKQKELKKIGTHEGPKVLKKMSTMKAYKKHDDDSYVSK